MSFPNGELPPCYSLDHLSPVIAGLARPQRHHLLSNDNGFYIFYFAQIVIPIF